jgi:hypothetical protein
MSKEEPKPTVSIQGVTIGGAFGEALAKLQMQVNTIMQELSFIRLSIQNIDNLSKQQLGNLKQEIEELKKKVLE